jgi:hypothetical protein
VLQDVGNSGSAAKKGGWSGEVMRARAQAILLRNVCVFVYYMDVIDVWYHNILVIQDKINSEVDKKIEVPVW